MDQPVFRKNEDGEIVEYQPVKVDLKALESELDLAQGDYDEASKTVSALEAQRDELDNQLKPAYERQEATQEVLAFRKARLEGFNAVSAGGVASADEASSNDVEDPTIEPTAGQPSAEDVADTLDLEPDTDEPKAAEEGPVAVPIRRLNRARV